MSVYVGKFNYAPYASNENMFVVFIEGWVERGRVLVFSTFTKDYWDVEKRAFDLTLAYVLQANDANVKTFKIRDLDEKAHYWFQGTRNDDSTITLTLQEGSTITGKFPIQLTKLVK